MVKKLPCCDDPYASKRTEAQQIAISCDDPFCSALHCAFQNTVIFRISANRDPLLRSNLKTGRKDCFGFSPNPVGRPRKAERQDAFEFFQKGKGDNGLPS